MLYNTVYIFLINYLYLYVSGRQRFYSKQLLPLPRATKMTNQFTFSSKQHRSVVNFPYFEQLVPSCVTNDSYLRFFFLLFLFFCVLRFSFFFFFLDFFSIKLGSISHNFRIIVTNIKQQEIINLFVIHQSLHVRSCCFFL